MIINIISLFIIIPFSISYRSALFRSSFEEYEAPAVFKKNCSQKSLEKISLGYAKAKGWDYKVPHQCKVVYPGGQQIDSQHKMKYDHVKQRPEVTWPHNTSTFYTLAFLHAHNTKDIDYAFHQTVGWLVGNIPGNNISAGTILCDYRFPYNSEPGAHEHYVFTVYQQKDVVSFVSFKPIDDPRINFPIEFFAKEYALGNPLAGNHFKLIP